jgi:hypothetical protein
MFNAVKPDIKNQPQKSPGIRKEIRKLYTFFFANAWRSAVKMQ